MAMNKDPQIQSNAGLVCSLVVCFLSMGMANAAWQNTKAVEFVVSAGSGGGADQMARFVSPLVSKYDLSPNHLS
jgi:tripartite-type tricarboxylate transporter receptor subunit TctC